MSPEQTTIGIVMALEVERRWTGATGDTALIEVGGMGRERAETAATRLLGRGASALVSWGIAGGIAPDLRSGTVVVPDRIIRPQGNDLIADADWRDRVLVKIRDLVPISVDPILHADEVVATPRRKNELHERWHAAAIDMESAGVARVAAEAGVPWLVVRAVGDTADQVIPKAATEICDDLGRLKIGAVAGLAFRPGLWPGLISLGRASAAAGRSMRKVWTAVVAGSGPSLSASDGGSDRE